MKINLNKQKHRILFIFPWLILYLTSLIILFINQGSQSLLCVLFSIGTMVLMLVSVLYLMFWDIKQEKINQKEMENKYNKELEEYKKKLLTEKQTLKDNNIKLD